MFKLDVVQGFYKADSTDSCLADRYTCACDIDENVAIYRCSTEQLLSLVETEKGIGIKSDISGKPIWIPKSKIKDWYPGDGWLPQGFVVSIRWARQYATPHSPYFFILPKFETSRETLRAALLVIKTTADEENVARIYDADYETRELVWQGLWNHMRGTYRCFDEYWTSKKPTLSMEAMWKIRSILLCRRGEEETNSC